MCSFGSCKTRFKFLSQFRNVRNAFECFVTQVQMRLPKTKRVWPMKINVICTVWLHRFKDTEGMMARWLHTLHQFQFTIVHRAGSDHGNADGLSRAPTDPCRQCTHVECPRVNTSVVVADQPFDDVSVGDSEDGDLIPLQSGEDWIAQLDNDLSRYARNCDFCGIIGITCRWTLMGSCGVSGVRQYHTW